MSSIRMDERFLSSTRGQIVVLLRRGALTVDELAQTMNLTDNAIRAHLISLERDGLIEQSGSRRGSGKPAFTYVLTSEAEHLFAKGYAPVLNELLTVLSDELGEEPVKQTLRTVGRRLAGESPADGDIQTRLDAAVETLNALGGLAESSIDGDQVTIRGHGCPLTAVSARHCKVCQLAEALVTEIVGVPMRERCDRGEHPRCRFEGSLS